MVATLNHDAFDKGEREVEHNYEPHNILYGNSGWTDALDDATLDLLVKTGAARLHKTISGVGFETRIYVSVNGKEPR